MAASKGARLFRRIVMSVGTAIALGYPLLFLHLRRQGITRWDLLLDAALAAFLTWFLWYAGRVRASRPHACPHCDGRLRRTRSPTGSRHWTCSACGFERERRRPRPGRNAVA